MVVEAECGILVYPPEAEGEPWRATFTENGRRRFRQASTEAGLAVTPVEQVTKHYLRDAIEGTSSSVIAGGWNERNSVRFEESSGIRGDQAYALRGGFCAALGAGLLGFMARAGQCVRNGAGHRRARSARRPRPSASR